MKQVDFYVKRKHGSIIHQLIKDCNVKKVFHLRITKGNTYFLVQGNNKNMSKFNVLTKKYKVD